MAEVLQRNAEVGDRIRELRKARRLTQPKVADRVKVTLRAYQAWESGENAVSWPNLEKLAVLFDVSPEYLQHGGQVTNPAHAATQLDRIESKLDELLARLDEDANERDEQMAELLAALRAAGTARNAPGRVRKARGS